ncbi:MAG: bifunctional UDP-N-acetylglucosamine diphosphorylase/glucosamine-1-phosphate N-acetyltransferase GlmU, partial [Moorella sp. (in: Bacteria)]|nr:bifunctional UDP-N-acetylglucosamine diphosphorylase/glucosamine-1-phosphate N-acetyltransferase GlmU [Moorella sp. (in: firmicutes)]
MELAAVILAAGKGTRMKSELPKVLHKICGRPMVSYVLKAVKGAGIERIVMVVGHRGELVAEAFQAEAAIVYQEPQLGTAHALLQAKGALADFGGHVLVLPGETPLVTERTLLDILEAHRSAHAFATVLTACLEEPAGYGRVVRDSSGRVVKIVEQKDATADELAIKEVNTGIYCFSADGLFAYLDRIRPDNAQNEYYLTDLVEIYLQNNRPVAAYRAARPEEVLGINDRRQLAQAEALLRRRKTDELMLSGVTVIDPASTFVDQEVVVGRDSVIYPFTVIEGNSVIGKNCAIGPGAHLKDVRIGENVLVTNSVVVESVVEDYCSIGPFAYIRPGCRLKRKVKIGDFVELKKTVVGENSKVPHLSYLGDTTVGADVNIGAGTITCNYDGVRKWPTYIGDGAFIGSNTNLVAPVEVGAGAVIGAGSTITKNVPPGALGVA